MIVDWRNRFGTAWISSVRDQGGTDNCWAFAMTALYEAMVRIEHEVWCRRSEGDQVRGTGKDFRSLGNLGEASIFAERYGIADPDCFPWTTSVAHYLSRPHGGDLQALPISPTPDRLGRAVRIAPGSFTDITDVSQKKQWLDTVGPLAAMFIPPPDFNGYQGGIYVPVQPGAGMAHAVIIVGFNDEEEFWIVKNSWRPTWGEQGFARIGYSANIIEPLSAKGLRGTNVDPLTRRRLRTGALLQSGNGPQHDNVELFIRCSNRLEQWWRDFPTTATWNRIGTVSNSDPYAEWHGDDVLDAPAVIQSTFNRNFEVLYRSSSGGVRHVHLDQSFGWWIDDATFGSASVTGIPGFVQGNRGAPADFEVVVGTQSGRLQHWTKHNSAPWSHPPGTWYLQQEFGTSIVHSGPGLLHSRNGIQGELEAGQGELHYVGGQADGTMAHYRRTAGGSWGLVGTFGAGVTSAPCLIEGQFGMTSELDVGNMELCVAVGAQIEHWWRAGRAQGPWTRSQIFGFDVRRVVGLIQGTGFNLELVAERTDSRYQHYWRDGTGWHAGAIIECKESKDNKDGKDRKDHKDGKDDDKPKKERDKLRPKEIDTASTQLEDQTPPTTEQPGSRPGTAPETEATGRSFVTDRPDVGGDLLSEPDWTARGNG